MGVWAGAFLCVCQLLAIMLLNSIDRKAECAKQVHENSVMESYEKVQLSDIQNFPCIFWLISINCAVVYICVLCFNNIGSSFFQTRFGYSSQNAGMIISITYFISAVFAPIFGRIVDQIGKRVWFMMVALFLMLIAHLAYFILDDCYQCPLSIPFLVLLGIGYAIYASVILSCVPLVIPKHTTGTAYGML